MTEEIFGALEQFYNGDVPGYIQSARKTFITIRVSDWEGTRTLKITIMDVIEYYATQARNITSGIRTIAGYSSDWRPIDQLAEEALAWFKYINHPQLVREGRKQGIILNV